MTDVVFTPPWRPLEHEIEKEGLPRQLERELVSGHPLWGNSCKVIGRADINDNIVVACSDGQYAIVHLDWGTGPGDRQHPQANFYSSASALNDALWRVAVWEVFVDEFDPSDPRLRES